MLTKAGSGTGLGAARETAAASRKRVRRPATPRASSPRTSTPHGSTPHGSTLALDLNAVADVTGLAQEVALLRASIRRLAQPDTETAEHVKVLAELRHQIEALCTALKTQQTLEGNGDARAAELARVLDELGDQLGVPR